MPIHRLARLYRLILSGALIIILLNALAGCSSSGDQRDLSQTDDQGPPIAGSSVFPVPPEIQPNVDFWRHVYGIWGRGQVAVHDDRYMGVIYEVIQLPGPIQEGYTESQRELIRGRSAAYSERLRGLEQRVRAGESLTDTDRALLAKLEKAGGQGAVYGAADRVRTQRGLRERFHRGVEISGRYDSAFREIMRSHGVPEDLAYLPHVESSFQTNARSSVGAAGVWQFMPATGRMFNMTVNDTIDDRMDPIIAADGAARYLSQAHRRLGSWPLAITSYNHGQGGMANAKAQHGNDIGKIVKQYQGPYFGFASRNFYAEFIAAREVTRNADRYFPEGVRHEEPWAHDRLVLRHSMPVDHLANHFGLTPYRLADLNKHWRDRAREGRAQLPAGSTVWLPAGTTRRVASHPPPVSGVMVAQAAPKATPVTRQAVAKSTQPASRAQTATNATSKSQAKQTLAKADSPKEKAQAKSKAAQATKAKTTLAKVDPPKQRAMPKAKPPEKTLAKATAKPRYHVVKPQETLYRVATQNGITVSELRRLNRMKPSENHIWVGQKLKVGS